MSKYQVKIENSILPDYYSFDELIANGLLDERDEHIRVKLIEENKWIVAYDYPFAEESKSMSYHINEYGEIVRNHESILDVSAEYIGFSENSSSRVINITTNGTWVISFSPASWVHLTPLGNSLTVRVDYNSSSNKRTDFFILKSGDKEKTIHIYQSGNNSAPNTLSSNNKTDDDGCIWWIIIGIIIVLFSLL